MIKYRYIFSFLKQLKVSDRDDKVNQLSLPDIVSDQPIRKPNLDEIFIVNNTKYLVVSVTISLTQIEDITYYDFLIKLRNIEYQSRDFNLTDEEIEILKKLT